MLTKAEFSPSIVESFVDNPEDSVRAQAMEDLFPGNPDSLVWIATTEVELFNFETLFAIRKTAHEIQKLDSVRSVVALPNLSRPSSLSAGLSGTMAKAMLNAQLKKGKAPDTTPKSIPILPVRSKPSTEELRKLGESLLESKSQVSALLSKDLKSQIMLIELAKQVMQPSDQVQLIEDLERIVQDNNLGQKGYYCSGLVPLQAYGFQEIYDVLWILLPLGILFISLAVFWVFRRIEVILITLLIAAISMAWGISLGILLFGKVSVLMAAVPLMVLVISTADVIHLISSYTAERNAGVEHQAAIAKTFFEVGGACVLTSITTFVGFISLMFVPANTIRQFGFSTAAGVASALLLSVVLVPIFLDLLYRLGRPVTAFASASRFTSNIAFACLRVGCARPKITLLIFIVGLGLCTYAAKDLHMDPDLTTRFRSNHPITKSTAFFHSHFGGINSAEILLRGEPEDLLTPETFAKLEEFKGWCEQKYGSENVASIDALVQLFLSQLDYKNPEGVPLSPEHAGATVQYLRNIAPDLVNSLVTPDGRNLRVLIRIEETSYLAMTEVSDAMVEKAESLFPKEIEVIQKGSAPVVGRAVREIIRGHMQGFVFCFTTIFFLIAFGLRSLTMASISALPNLTPLLLIGGLITVFREVADSDLLAVATLGLGLAVDDTIHFLSRFNIEWKSGKSLEESLRLSMEHTGLAIIRTTLILSVGFVPLAFSTYLSINMLGTYLIVVLLAAVLADLVLLPAIIQMVFAKKTNPNTTSVSS
ncbi:MAG: MMPL family transporter [Planctomycetota bacterium]